jgi:hypothetical protein
MWHARFEVVKELLPKARFFSDVTPCQRGRYFPMLLHTVVCFKGVIVNSLQKVSNK